MLGKQLREFWNHRANYRAWGTFRQLSAGQNHSCAVRTDGTIACWGYNNNGQATAPAGVFQ